MTNQGGFGSGTSTFGSGTSTFGSGTGAFGSGTGAFGSGTGAFGSGTGGFGTGTGGFGTGTGGFGTGTGGFGTGTGGFGTGNSGFGMAPKSGSSGISLTPEPVRLKIDNRDTVLSIMSIASLKEYRARTLMEVRLQDYQQLGKIGQKIAQDSTPAAAPSTATVPAAAEPAKSFGFGGGAAANERKQEIDKLRNLGLSIPLCKPVVVRTAKSHFVPSEVGLRGIAADGDDDDVKQHRVIEIDYNRLFWSMRPDETRDVKPIIVRKGQLQLIAPDLRNTTGRSDAREAEFMTIPPISELSMLGNVVPNFRVWKENVAMIDFQGDVDLGNVDLERDVKLSAGFVDVYRSKREMPKPGTGLNRRAVVSMWGVWPKNQETGTRKRPDKEGDEEYSDELRRFCASKHAVFTFYVADRGFLQFVVEGFRDGPYDIP